MKKLVVKVGYEEDDNGEPGDGEYGTITINAPLKYVKRYLSRFPESVSKEFLETSNGTKILITLRFWDIVTLDWYECTSRNEFNRIVKYMEKMKAEDLVDNGSIFNRMKFW